MGWRRSADSQEALDPGQPLLHLAQDLSLLAVGCPMLTVGCIQAVAQLVGSALLVPDDGEHGYSDCDYLLDRVHIHDTIVARRNAEHSSIA